MERNPLFPVNKRIKGLVEKWPLRSISLDAFTPGLEKLTVSGRAIESGSTVNRILFRDWAARKTFSL